MKDFWIIICLLGYYSGSSQPNDSLIRQQFNVLIDESIHSLDLELYQKAHALTNTAEKLVLDSLRAPHALIGHCYFNRARIYRRKKDLDSAVVWYLNAKVAWENTLGKNHPIYLNSIYQLGLVYREMSAFKKAQGSFLDLKEILLKSVGKSDSSYIECLNSLGLVYMDREEFKKAEDILLEAYTIQLKQPDTLHSQLANTLNNQALLSKKTGKYESAIHSLKEVLAIRERNPGKRSLIYTISLGNLATLYKEIGNYEKAEEAYLEAWELRSLTYGNTHAYTLGSLENLAGLYREMGDTEKAISLYKQINGSRKKIMGPHNSTYCIGLNHLANTYKDIHKPQEALPLYLEVLQIRAKNLPAYQKEYLETLNHLSSVYIATDRLDSAMSCCKLALHFCDSVFGKSISLYANCLTELGLLEMQLGYCIEAEQHFAEASLIYKQNFGQDHYRYAESLDKLGSLHLDLGQFDKAEPLFMQSKKIKEKILGKKHALYLESLDQLGVFYELQKKYGSSDPLFRELSEADQERLIAAAGYLTEKELENYLTSFQVRSDKFGSYVLLRSKHPREQGNLSTSVLNNNLFYKGFLLTSARQLNNLAAISKESQELHTQLKNIRKLLGRAYMDPQSKAKDIKKLEDKANYLEKQLRKTVSGFTSGIESIKWEQVKETLSDHEAAIEFIHFKDITDSINNSLKYAAIVIKPELERPEFIPLFEENVLASLLPHDPEFQSAIISNLYTSHRGSSKKLTTKRPDLYELIWQPLDSILKDVTTIYYSPSGVLHRLNLNAIPVGAKEILADRFKMVNVNSTRQLASTPTAYSTHNQVLLMGGINYNYSIDTILNSFQETSIPDEITFQKEPDELNTCEEFPYLPGTAEEVDSVHRIMQLAGLSVAIRKGAEATESYFKSFGQFHKKSPRIILLATHGYFYQTHNDLNESTHADKSGPKFKTSSDPMFRSGMILAGGNKAWNGNPIDQSREDGILTAYEISQMNLSNTELVVLSACETGLGDIRGSEGVYGLQRAFKIAGAKHLIMSLWKVSDYTTTILMTEFYNNWLLENMTIPNAFDAAQKYLRNRFIDPYLWAGFILIE